MQTQSSVYLLLTCIVTSFAGCPEIVSGKIWGAIPPTEVEYTIIPIPYAIIHHTAGRSCDSESSCSGLVASIQNYHMKDLKYNDIGYNFLIGGDGRVYQGVGWHYKGAHTLGYNPRSIGISFIGNFEENMPTPQALQAAKDLLQCGVELGELDEDYKLIGAKQVRATLSPGQHVYREIQDWTHYTTTP